MRVFVAGGTGVVGRRLLPMLVESGHEVVGLARSPQTADQVRGAGARPVVADALDRSAVIAAIEEAKPDAVVHQLTAIPPGLDPSRIDVQFELTNRLRTEGTHNLLDGAKAVGAHRFVAQSIAFAYEPTGGAVKSEDDPVWDRPPREFAGIVDAIRTLERDTVAAGGTVLRYGHFYGPGTSRAADGSTIAQIRAGQLPIVGGGTAVFSFTHVDDAAGAVVAALTAPDPAGIFNIVDGDPVPCSEWVTELARQLGAPAPNEVPVEAVRERIGGYGVAYSTQLRGASNARAKEVLNWTPIHPSWRSTMVEETVTRRQA
jgi:nucleoside-diphosphate-sugar epimerase